MGVVVSLSNLQFTHDKLYTLTTEIHHYLLASTKDDRSMSSDADKLSELYRKVARGAISLLSGTHSVFVSADEGGLPCVTSMCGLWKRLVSKQL